jgi:hypothetical protein
MTAKSQELINFGSFDNTINPIMQSSNPENIFMGNAFPSTPSIPQYPMTPHNLRPNRESNSNISNTVVSDITGNIFLDGSNASDQDQNEACSMGNSDINLQEKRTKQMSEENNILVNKMIKNNSFQNVSNSVDYYNQNVFIKRRSQMKVKNQTSSNEYYKHYSVTDKEYTSFIDGLKRKLYHMTKLLLKESRMKPSSFWGQQQSSLNKSLVLRDKKEENQVREQSEKVQLNLQVIINRSNDPNLIKNRYLIKGHIAESTFSNTFRVRSNLVSRSEGIRSEGSMCKKNKR